MQDLTIFNFQERTIRTIIDNDNIIWFVANDVAEALGYQKPNNAVNQHCKGALKQCPLTTSGGTQTVRIINEGDMYRLIFSSKLPSAVEFERVVVEEVLPSIRKHGAYIAPDKLEDALTDINIMTQLLSDLKDERLKRTEAEQMNSFLMHTGRTYTATEIAKELGVRSPVKLNHLLAQDKIQFKRNGLWLPFAKYTEAGYMTIKQEPQKAFYSTRWTQKGRSFLLSKYAGGKLLAQQ